MQVLLFIPFCQEQAKRSVFLPGTRVHFLLPRTQQFIFFLCTVRAPVFDRHQFFGTSEHYRKAHGCLLSWWMNYYYTGCCWFPTSSNILILLSQFWQIRFRWKLLIALFKVPNTGVFTVHYILSLYYSCLQVIPIPFKTSNHGKKHPVILWYEALNSPPPLPHTHTRFNVWTIPF